MNKLLNLYLLFLPCLLNAQTTGTITDTRDGRVYPTVKIGNKWWMAENLNHGTRIMGNVNQSNNGTTEKYCYNNLESNCDTLGALYQWDEMMNYTTNTINQGICPAEWHVPSDDEWKELEIYLGMSEADADLTGFRGTDEGTQLKKGGSSGFNASLDGYMTASNNFMRYGTGNCFWTATDIYARYLLNTSTQVYRWATPLKSYGLSLRCVKSDDYYEQAVSYVPASRSSLHYSWADFDNDNDLDLLITSNELNKSIYQLEAQKYTSIFYNNGNGGFSKAFSIKDSVSMGSSSVGDYDNDGDLDFILSGARGIRYSFPIVVGFPYTRIYQNNSTSFDTLHANLVNLCRSAVEFQDLDNDGDLDIIICGDRTFTSFVFHPATIVYRNIGSGVFEKMDTELKAVAGGRIACFDYDRNGFSDILLTGMDQNQEVFCAIYKNSGDYSFIPVILSLDSIRVNYNAWFDYSGDGNFDIIAGGKLFKNAGSDIFTSNTNLLHCSGFGDFNNDGYSDIINKNNIYINNNGQNFIVDKYALHDQQYSCADINNDGKMDIVGKSFQYFNNAIKINTSPSVPGNLRTYLAEGKAVFKWDPVSDNETGPEGITYNVCIGTSTNPQQYFSSGSDLSTGYRRIMKFGNAGSNDSIAIERIGSNLRWQVQTVDNNMLASQFSEAKLFSFPMAFDNALNTSWHLEYQWGDFTSDGKMDYICKGTYWSGPESYNLDKNMGNMNFESIPSNITLTKNTDWRWCDYDGDNDIDLIGMDSNLIGINIDTANFTFIDHSFPVGSWGKLSVIKDLDNDGDYDYIISSASDTRIYFRESGGTFTTFLLENEACDSVISFDYDNDSDNDIFMRETKSRFVNTGYRKFSKTHLNVVPFGLTYDFDNDGDVDVFDNSILFKNQNQVFYTENTNIRKLSGKYEHSAGDFDNDGDFDIILAGDLQNNDYLGLYLNDGSGKFTEDNVFSRLWNVSYSSISNFADFDSDNDLDFVFEYKELDMGTQLALYERNNFNKPDSRPDAPTNLEPSKTGHGIELSWTAPNDKESGTHLTYNLRIGTSPNGTDIMSPASDLNTGNLYIPETGCIFQPFWKTDTMALGKYYWSVQAVDHGFRGGLWAKEQSFTISNLRADFRADTVCLGSSTSFSDQSVVFSGIISNWHWDFGDGTSSTAKNPKHPFPESGIHYVTLKVTAGQDVDSITKPIFVKHKPHPGFTAGTVCEGKKTTITDQSDTDSITVAEWQWSFGDGDVSTVQGNPQHLYPGPGNYTAQLRITATNGCADSLSKQVIIGEYPNATIGLIDKDETVRICMGDSSTLSVQYVSSYVYQWKKDGLNLTNETLSYLVIKNNGNYSVVINNPLGNCRDTSDVVPVSTIEAPPRVVITADSDTNICQGDSVYFEVPYSEYSCQWYYNGDPILNATSNWLYAEKEGSYTVVLSYGSCKTPSQSKKVVYKPGLPKPTLTVRGPNLWYFICSIEHAKVYRWYYNGNLVAENSKNLFYAGTSLGEYYVEVNDGGECFVPSDKVVIPLVPIAISQTETRNEVYIYPNPTDGRIRILYSSPFSGKVVIKIYDAEGRCAKEQEFNKENFSFSEEMELSGFTPGIYIMELNMNQVVLKTRFLTF